MKANSPIVYVLGASGRAAAESVRHAGFRAVVVDRFADRDSGPLEDVIAIREYPASILEQMSALPRGWILLAGGMENHPELINSLSEFHEVIGPNATQLKTFRSLGFLVDSIPNDDEANRLRFPETWIRTDDNRWKQVTNQVISNVADSSSAPKLGRSARWLKKSLTGAGGFHIERFDAYQIGSVDFEGFYIQREIEGRSIGTVFFCSFDRTELIGATEAISKELYQQMCGSSEDLPPMAYRGSYGPIELDESLRNNMCDWMHSVAQKTKYVGLMQVDWLIDQKGTAWLLELNPRWTAGMEILEWATQKNLFAEHAKRYSNCENDSLVRTFSGAEKVLRPNTPCKTLVKLILYADSSVCFTEEQSRGMMSRKFNRFEDSNWIAKNEVRWSDIPHENTFIDMGHPIASCFVKGNTDEMNGIDRSISPKISLR